MPAFKARHPLTFAGAVHRCIDELGYDHAANVVGKSVSTVTKWADPDHPALPKLTHALVLDAAYQETTGERGPIIAVYERQLDRLSDPNLGDADADVPVRLLGVVADVIDIHRLLESEGRRLPAMNHTHLCGVQNLIAKARRELDGLSTDVEAAKATRDIHPRAVKIVDLKDAAE